LLKGNTSKVASNVAIVIPNFFHHDANVAIGSGISGGGPLLLKSMAQVHTIRLDLH